jgi:hypothetical protein
MALTLARGAAVAVADAHSVRPGSIPRRAIIRLSAFRPASEIWRAINWPLPLNQPARFLRALPLFPGCGQWSALVSQQAIEHEKLTAGFAPVTQPSVLIYCCVFCMCIKVVMI